MSYMFLVVILKENLQILEARVEGRRYRGRQRITYIDIINIKGKPGKLK